MRQPPEGRYIYNCWREGEWYCISSWINGQLVGDQSKDSYSHAISNLRWKCEQVWDEEHMPPWNEFKRWYRDT
jgi:hypothetical protein